MDWAKIAPEFKFDGSWRDIYVPNAGVQGWAAVWERLCGLTPAPVLHRANSSGPMPPRFEWPGQVAGGRAHLSVKFGEITFNCHFFDDDEIEFDFDPREVRGANDTKDVAAFMALLGEATAEPVLLTWENAREAVIARYDPRLSEIEWLPLSKQAT